MAPAMFQPAKAMPRSREPAATMSRSYLMSHERWSSARPSCGPSRTLLVSVLRKAPQTQVPSWTSTPAPSASARASLDAVTLSSIVVLSRSAPVIRWPKNCGYVERHHGGGDGVFVDQRDLHAGPGRFDGGGRPGYPRSHDHQWLGFHVRIPPVGLEACSTSPVRVDSAQGRAGATLHSHEVRAGRASRRALV